MVDFWAYACKFFCTLSSCTWVLELSFFSFLIFLFRNDCGLSQGVVAWDFIARSMRLLVHCIKFSRVRKVIFTWHVSIQKGQNIGETKKVTYLFTDWAMDNRVKWLWNPAKFFVVGFCSLLYRTSLLLNCDISVHYVESIASNAILQIWNNLLPKFPKQWQSIIYLFVIYFF